MRDLPKLLREAERRVNARVFNRSGDSSLASIPANRDRDVDLLLMEAADALESANKAIWAMAEDGWLYFGPEGMSPAQQLVSDYTLKYCAPPETEANQK